MRRVLPLTLPLALGALLVLPSAASAAITTTQVVTPAQGAYRFADESGGSSPSIIIGGTSDASAAGDKVDVVCVYYADNGGFATQDIATNVDTADVGGAWSYTGNPGPLVETPCLVVAVPAGTSVTSPADITNFHGHLVYGARFYRTAIAAGPNAGKVRTWRIAQFTGSAYNQIDGFDDCAICYSSLLTTVGGIPHISNYVWYFNDSPYANATSPMATTLGVTMDGNVAFGPMHAAAVNTTPTLGADMTGYQGYTLTFTPSSGRAPLVINESFTFVRCNADTHTKTPGATCTQWVSTGVRVHRTYKVLADGQRVLVHDQFSSTDHAAHTLQLQLWEAIEYYDNMVEPLFMPTWISNSWTLEPNGAVLARPTKHNWRFYTRPSANPIAFQHPVGSLVVTDPPASVRFPTNDHWDLLHLQSIAVPASGSAERQQGYTIGSTMAKATTGADWFEDLFTQPRLAAVKPHNHARIHAAKVRVSGRAIDAGHVAKVTVNGHRAHLAASGKFRYTLKLHAGANTIHIAVTDGADNVVRRTLHVRRA